MIPIKLTIKGLYSYQEQQTIDFTKLTGANLFGIFGSVGSGKSSILEAITFAIYGRTDRLNITGDDRYYNMMNLKSNELFIEFDFETGKEQTAYKAVVSGKRNGKNFDEVKALTRTAYRNEEGVLIPIETETLERAIGLSYDNFKRTIIIPQGQFQEFLQLGNKDRTQMMKELFNLEKYELYFKVTSLEFKNNAEIQNYKGQLQQLGQVDPHQVKDFEEQLILVNEEMLMLSKTLQDYLVKDAELKKLQQLVKMMADTEQKFLQLKEQETAISALETTIVNYEKCVLNFKSIVDALTSSNQRLEQKQVQIEKETISLKKSDDDLMICESAYAELKLAYDTRDRLKQKADELIKMGKMNDLSANILNEQGRIAKGRIFLDETIAKAEGLKKEKEQLEQVIKAAKAKLPDLAMLSKVKTWHVENNNLCQQRESLKIDILKQEKEKDSIQQAVANNFNHPVFADMQKGNDISAAIQYLKDHIEQLKLQLLELSHHIDHYRVQAKLDEYAVNLKDGEACPLCGSLEHPMVFSPASLAETINQAIRQKEAMEKQVTDANEKIMQLTNLSHQISFKIGYIKELEEKIKLNDAKLTSHKATFKWEGYGDENTVGKAFAMAETMEKEIRLKEENLDAVVKQLDKEIQNKDKFQKEIVKLETSLTISQTEVKTLKQQIHLVKAEEYAPKNFMEIEAEHRTLLQTHSRLEKQFNELTLQLNQLRKVKDTISGTLEAHQKELLLEKETNEKLQKEFSNLLLKARYKSIDEVKEILAQDINPEAEKQRCAEFRHQMSLLQSQTKQLLFEIDNRSYDGDDHKKIAAEINTISESLNQKNRLYGSTNELLRKLKKDLEIKAQLIHKLGELELRASNIRVMKSLFKGSGFVNFISSVYLQNLCNAANDRFFQLTRQKLSLEITDDNCFQVRDFMNGGKQRSVKTLSGGQTFQAALSLALALADNIQKITDSNQNFFFLDEGFGSLDKDSLSVVFDSLKSLRKENRIVGVISHVEEMQQEIDTHLRVENQEETGSKIMTSWS